VESFAALAGGLQSQPKEMTDRGRIFFGGINIFFDENRKKNEMRKISSKFCHEMAAWT
jgi:hypothetical protein